MKPPLIVVFLKWPKPGYVKTRLASKVGNAKAVTIYKALVRAVGLRLAQCQKEHLAICYAPASEADSIQRWIADDVFRECEIQHWWPQPEMDLGGRQAAAVEKAFALNYESVALIGTDCIDLDADTFARTWTALDEGAGWVFGPANDGGYYLGATKQGAANAESVFAKVRWSSEHTLSDCQKNITSRDSSFFTIETLADVDEYDDWQLVKNRLPS